MPTDEARKIRFILSGIVVEGATAYAESEFIPLHENLQAKEVSLADVYAVAEAIDKKYRDDGYILSRAGAVWNFAAGGSSTIGASRESLMSAGLGLRIDFLDRFSAYGEIAKPMLRGVAARGGEARDPRYFFGVNARFRRQPKGPDDALAGPSKTGASDGN